MLLFQRFLLILLFFYFSQTACQSTASQQVTSFRIESSQLKDQREIWIYLPKSYQNSNKAYPVMYMFDGQNIFDAESAYAGEWEVDEYLDKISADQIVVAIAHGNAERINELTPFKNEEYGGGKGKLFLEFIISELKPYIDQNYRTLKDKQNTSIAGASLGGLMAFYALLTHPEIFSQALSLSPSFWFNPEVLNLVRSTQIPTTSRFYIVMGSKEGELMSNAYDHILELLLSKDLFHDQLYMELVENGIHSESFWQKQYEYGYNWLTKQ